MNKMNKILLLLGFISFATTVNAQSGLTIEASQLYTSFKFSDSQGTSGNSEYSGILRGSYGAGYIHVTEKGIMLRGGLYLRKAGATMVYDNMNYTWNLQYLDAKIGGGYMLKKNRLSPYFNIFGYYSYMLSGYQTINNEDFDIRQSKSIDAIDFGVSFTPGVQITISENLYSVLEFSYCLGLQNLDTNEGQKASNISYGINLGLRFSFGK